MMTEVKVELEVEEPLCGICGYAKSNHDFKHEFSIEGALRVMPSVESSSGDKPSSQGSLGIALRGDPVLRIALIRAGVISAENLNSVEAELRASGVAAATPQPLA